MPLLPKQFLQYHPLLKVASLPHNTLNSLYVSVFISSDVDIILYDNEGEQIAVCNDSSQL